MRTPLFLLLALALPLAGCDLLSLLGPTGDCAQDSDCFGDDLCVDGECVECENDRDCDDDEECDDGECERTGGEGEGEGEGEPGEGEGEGDPGEGEGEGEPPGCGAVPDTGICVGNTSRYCDTTTNTVEEENCSNFTPDLQCQAAFGLNMCAADAGDDCIVEDDNGDKVVAFCADEGVGCRLGSGVTGTCQGGPGTCAASDVNRCIGGDFILRCTAEIGYPWYVDCDARSGTCDNAQGGCVLPSASACIPDEGTGYNDLCTPPGGGTATACPSGGTCP